MNSFADLNSIREVDKVSFLNLLQAKRGAHNICKLKSFSQPMITKTSS